ncbi:MAG: fumarylacetoacetate hydrolase family protein [Myxococcales bacterium]|nr:fumarylacetoacetate hydrolase family protein [Myxococcales bacterium]
MRVATVEVEGTIRIGVVTSEGIVDATSRVGGETNLRQLLANQQLDGLAPLASATPDLRFEEVRFLPPIIDSQHIVAAGVNYDSHRRETGRDRSAHPTLFIRWPSSIVGHREPVVRPSVSERYDFEGELAVIIGRRGRRIAQSQALNYIAGYTCFHDGSVRDYQRHTSQFTPGKNFDKSGGCGPWMVTKDEVPDPSTLVLTTRLNRTVVQQASVSDLIFDIPHLIEYISTFVTLEPGDMIVTGTPSGVGDKRTPRRYLRGGDILEVEISGLGTLMHPVVHETTSAQ